VLYKISYLNSVENDVYEYNSHVIEMATKKKNSRNRSNLKVNSYCKEDKLDFMMLLDFTKKTRASTLFSANSSL